MRKKIFILLLIASSSLIMALTPQDSLSELSYHDLETRGVAFFLEKKYDKANLFFNEMLKRQNSKENPSKKELGVIYYSLGRIAQGENELNKAILLFEKAANFYKKQTIHDKIEADLYFYMAVAYYQNKKKEKALECSKKAIILSERTYGPNASFTASCMVSYAIMLYNMKYQDKAIEVLKKAHKIYALSEKEKRAAERIAKLLKKWTSK